MSILIKGIEMPKSGDMTIVITSSGYVEDVSGQVIEGVEAIPVPPHGRLIDGDYLKHTHCAECTLYPDKCLEKTADGCDWGSIIHLRMCPTIIPSDKEDGNESRT